MDRTCSPRRSASPRSGDHGIQLPNVSGIDLIAQLKADNDLNGVPVLAVTAYAGKGDEERIRDAGAADYLAKPVSIGPFMTADNAAQPSRPSFRNRIRLFKVTNRPIMKTL